MESKSWKGLENMMDPEYCRNPIRRLSNINFGNIHILRNTYWLYNGIPTRGTRFFQLASPHWSLSCSISYQQHQEHWFIQYKRRRKYKQHPHNNIMRFVNASFCHNFLNWIIYSCRDYYLQKALQSTMIYCIAFIILRSRWAP